VEKLPLIEEIRVCIEKVFFAILGPSLVSMFIQ